jgi:hypothetical protein
MIASLVNLDDLVLVGPGSEWFWTAVSGIVLGITFLLIYRQLRAQAAANALQRIETVHSQWRSKELILARLEVALALRDGTLDMTNDTRIDVIADFFELVGNLRDQHYLGDAEIERSYGASIEIWWQLLAPGIRELRLTERDPGLWDGLEDLATMIGRFQARRGVNRVWNELPREALLASVIERSAHRLRLMHDAETGVIPDTTPPAARAEGVVVAGQVAAEAAD